MIHKKLGYINFWSNESKWGYVQAMAYLGGIGPWPPFGKKILFDIVKKLENLVSPFV